MLGRPRERGLLIIDIQEEFVARLSPGERDGLSGNQYEAISVARENGVHMYIAQLGTDSPVVGEIHRWTQGDAITYYRFHPDALTNQVLLQTLHEDDIGTLVLTGVSADHQVLCTAESARRHRIRVASALSLLANLPEYGRVEEGKFVRAFGKNILGYRDVLDLLRKP